MMWKQTQTRTLCANGGRHCNDAIINQGTPRFLAITEIQWRVMKQIFPPKGIRLTDIFISDFWPTAL